MKNKTFVFGSLTALLLITGCSQKSSTESDMNQQQAPESADSRIDDVAGVGSGEDNFVDMDKRSAAIRELEEKLQTIYFDFDKYDVRANQQNAVDTDAKILSGDEAQPFTIKVEGNCDEWGTDEYNYALGLKRAKSVRDSLSAKGVTADRMIMVSYGESKPTCSEKTKTCWANNRRVDFKLLP